MIIFVIIIIQFTPLTDKVGWEGGGGRGRRDVGTFQQKITFVERQIVVILGR